MAASHNTRLYLILASCTPMSTYVGTTAAYHTRIDNLGLEHLIGHTGIFGYDICNEPTYDNTTLNTQLIDYLQYVAAKDPSHGVSLGLTTQHATDELNRAYIAQFEPYMDFIDVHNYNAQAFIDETLTEELENYFDNVVTPAANGKRIQVGEMGLWTENGTDLGLTDYTFTQADQANYYQIYGAVTQTRDITVFAYTLEDTDPEWGYPNYGQYTFIDSPKASSVVIQQYLGVPILDFTVTSTPTDTITSLYSNTWASNLLLLGAITVTAGLIYKFTEKWHQY